VPLLLRHPRLLPRGKVWTSGVNSVDVMPTLLAAAGLPIPGGVQGRSLLEVVRSGRDRWDRPIILQNITQKARDGEQPVERAVRTERWKLILREFSADHDRRMDELYDLESDPGERYDLFPQAESAGRVKELSRMLLDWGRRYEDEVAVRLALRYA